MFHIRPFIAAAALALAAPSIASDSPTFPRLGGVNMGGPHNYDSPDYQAKLAKLHLSVLNVWPGWENTRSMTMEGVVRNIHAINPNSKVFLYHISMEVDDNALAHAPVRAKVDQMKWWAYANGSRVVSEFGRNTGKPVHVINTSLFTPRDSNGQQWWEWDTRYTVNTYYKPNPSIAGFFEDNVFWKPRENADLNRDGVTDSHTSSTMQTWLRQGYVKRFDLLKELMPGKYQIGNIADWGAKDAVLTEYQGMLHGGIMEGIIGTSYAPEKWASWSEMLRWYRKTMAAVAAPKLVIFNQHGSPTDYQAMRYGLASCLLDDAYFAYTDSAKGYTGVVWFDEYNAKLGKAISPPTMSAWKNGVWRRDFENGIALVNPRGNGAVTVELEEEFRRLSGSQAPAVNSGQLTTSVRLNDRDGIILLRKQARTLPSPPKLTAVQ